MSTSQSAGNLQRTGEYRTRGVPTFHGLRWTFEIPKGNVWASSYTLLADDGTLYVGRANGSCHAIDMQTGKPRWRFPAAAEDEEKADSSMALSAALMTDTVFVGTSTGTIRGLDASTGRQVWRSHISELIEASTAGPLPPWRELRLCQVTVMERLLLLSIDDSGGDTGIYAVDPAEKVCVRKVLNPAGIHGPLTISDHMLYYFVMLIGGCGDGIFMAFDMQTQRCVWSTSCDGGHGVEEDGEEIIPLFVAHADDILPLMNETVYVVGHHDPRPDEENEEEYGDSHGLYALDAHTGKVRWAYYDDDFQHGCYVAVANGLVYVTARDGKNAGRLFAVDMNTHQLRWKNQLDVGLPCRAARGSDSSPSYAAPILADGLLYLGRSDGQVITLDALTGEERWRHQLDGPIEQPCLVAGGVVYVIAGRTLYALH